MEWSTFLTWLGGGYFLYYLVNILLDLFFQGKGNQPDERTINYDINSLIDEDESPTKVDHSLFSQHSQEDQEVLTPAEEFVPVKEIKEFPKDRKPEVKPVNPISGNKEREEISFDRPPEGQGIPLKDFLMDARKQSSKIQFS